MRLHSLEIDRFKNLRDFNINFDSDSIIDVIIGKNGSGKSNFFEAIIDIFKFLSDPKSPSAFNFTINYSIKNTQYTVASKDGKLTLNDKSKMRITSKALPENILIYYSGHNDRVAGLVEEYEKSYRSRIKGDEVKELRRFFGFTKEHKSILLLLILMLADGSVVKSQMTSRLNAAHISSDIKIILKRPFFCDKPLESWDDMKFWGTKGYLADFLANLYKLSNNGKIIRKEGYFAESEQFFLYVPSEKIKELIASKTPIQIFQFFDDLRLIGMLESIDFEIELQSREKIRLSEFSDGECQTVFFSGMLELFKERDCILLLDEPDAFLHPEWQFELVKQIIEHAGNSSSTNHLILSSHCASTLVSSQDSRINLFEVTDKNVSCHAVSKEYAINKLSAGLITLNENKQTLSILSKIKVSNKPILFTEGESDVKIIETAWMKLYDTIPPFIIIQAFDCGYLRKLLQNEKILKEMKEARTNVFGLFDFDEAYNDWDQIKYDSLIEKDPYKGLCKKIKDYSGYVYLLPVPSNECIQKQVIKNHETKETFKNDSNLSIELLFFGNDGVADYFCKKNVPGGGEIINFKNNNSKMTFAHDIVPTLPPTAFVAFSPLFDSIISKIKQHSHENSNSHDAN